MPRTSPIVRALRAAHLHDASRAELLQLACDRLRGLGAPYTSVYAYMLHDGGTELVLEAFSGRETEHTRIPVGRGVCGTAVATGEDQNVPDVAAIGNYLACNLETKAELADQHHPLGLRLPGAREGVPDGPYVRDVLILAGRPPPAAHTLADRNPVVLRLPSRKRLEHQLAPTVLQHVGVDGRVRRAQAAQPVAGELQQRRSRGVVQVRGA